MPLWPSWSRLTLTPRPRQRRRSLPQTPRPAQAPAGEALPADELRAIRRLIEEQRAEGARRETQVQTLERLVRGEDLTPPTSTQPAEPVRPRSEDFQSHEEYVEAVADFKASEKVAAFRQEQQQERQQTQQRQQLLSA